MTRAGRKPQRVGTRWLSAGTLVVLTVAVALQNANVHAKTDILSDIYKNKGLEPPVKPRTYSDAITDLLAEYDVEFTDLSTQMQRVVLWSTGWVRAIPATASSSSDSGSYSYSSSTDAEDKSNLYVQVYVECGRTMSGVFLTASAFDNETLCSLKSCKANVITFTMSACEPSFVEDKTLCAVSPAAESNWSLQERSGPLWSVDGQVGDSFDPQLFKYGNTTVAESDNTSIYMLTEQASWGMGDNSCPTSAQFIAPCREVEASEVDPDKQELTWCVPEIELSVRLLLDAEYGSASTSSATDTSTGSDGSSSGVSTTVVIVLAVLLALLAIACIVLFFMMRRSRRMSKYNRAGGPNGEHEAGYFAAAGSFNGNNQQGGNSMQLDNVGRPTMGGMQYSSSNGQPKMSFETAAQVEAINEGFRQRSSTLAAFCDDQELMLKRVAFAGLVFRQQLSSGSNGEVWSGEYEGQQVAIKCTIAAAAAASAAAAGSSRGSSAATSSSIVSALTESELRALEHFTKEIRMAAFLEHPNIVRFVGLSWRTLPDLCMVSEFMVMGDLAHFLSSKESVHLTWKDEKLPIAADVANALVYLHSLSPIILHRDLKSLNVLLTEDLQAKVSDFGLSRERSYDETMTSGVGTLLWTAPEVLRGEQYSEKADIYSFGVVLSELDTCLPPYSLNKTSSKGKKKIMDWVPLIASGEATPKFRPDCPPAIMELAAQCLDPEPNNRPPAMQIVYMLRSKIRLTLS